MSNNTNKENRGGIFMYCPNCGAQNENTYNNCTSCGMYIADINKKEREKQEQPLDINEEVEPAVEEVLEDTTQYKEPEPERHTPEKKYYEAIYRQYVKKPKDYFVFSILCTIFGSIGFGIAAIVFSVMTKAEINAGNIKKAGIYSQNTRTFCIFSVIIGIIKYVFAAIIIAACFSSLSYRYYSSPFFW